ncbi:hypothetical protein D3C80_130180 [compost metagenome]
MVVGQPGVPKDMDDRTATFPYEFDFMCLSAIDHDNCIIGFFETKHCFLKFFEPDVCINLIDTNVGSHGLHDSANRPTVVVVDNRPVNVQFIQTVTEAFKDAFNGSDELGTFDIDNETVSINTIAEHIVTT